LILVHEREKKSLQKRVEDLSCGEDGMTEGVSESVRRSFACIVIFVNVSLTLIELNDAGRSDC
jgi:hypothetical protein